VRAVLEHDGAGEHREALNVQPRRLGGFLLCLRLRRRGGKSPGEIGEIQLATRAQHRAYIGLLEQDVAEAGAEPPDRGELQRHAQMPEGQQRLAVGIRQRHAAYVECQREGIEVDLTDTERAAVVRSHEIHGALAGEVGYGEKARGRIGADQHQDDGESDEVAPIAAHATRSACCSAGILVHRRQRHHVARVRDLPCRYA